MNPRTQNEMTQIYEDEMGFNADDKNALEMVAPKTEKENSLNYSQWGIHSGGKYTPAMSTTPQLPSGFYEIGHEGQIGTFMELKKVNTDELYQLPSPELTDIIEDIEKFWNRADKYKEYGFLHKRGILLYGDPGAGKSGIIQLCTKHLIEKMNGIVINLTNGDQIELYSKFISSLRTVEPNRPLIVILEDIDGIAGEGTWSTSMLLNLLDGVKQIDNVVYIATTNYPEKLEERITNRPSRFDRRYKVELPNDEIREAYIRHKLTDEDIKNVDITEWVKRTDGMSLSHLKEVVISTIVMGREFEEVMDNLEGLKKAPSIKGSGIVGFGK